MGIPGLKILRTRDLIDGKLNNLDWHSTAWIATLRETLIISTGWLQDKRDKSLRCMVKHQNRWEHGSHYPASRRRKLTKFWKNTSREWEKTRHRQLQRLDHRLSGRRTILWYGQTLQMYATHLRACHNKITPSVIILIVDDFPRDFPPSFSGQKRLLLTVLGDQWLTTSQHHNHSLYRHNRGQNTTHRNTLVLFMELGLTGQHTDLHQMLTGLNPV